MDFCYVLGLLLKVIFFSSELPHLLHDSLFLFAAVTFTVRGDKSDPIRSPLTLCNL